MSTKVNNIPEKNITYYVIDQKNLNYLFQVKVSSNYLEVKTKDCLLDMQKNSHMKGFRPGKVPLAYLQNKYHKQLKQEVSQLVIAEAIQEILEQYKIQPFLDPLLLEINDIPGIGLKLQIRVISLPDIVETQFTDLSLYHLQVEITEEDIKSFINKLQTHKLTWKNCVNQADLKVESQDQVKLHITSHVNNKRCADLDAEGLSIMIGSEDLDIKIDQAVLNHKLHDIVTVDTVVNARMTTDQQWLGKNIKCKITIAAIYKPVTNEGKFIALKDRIQALIKALQLPNADALYQLASTQIKHYVGQVRSLYLRRQLLDHLDNINDFAIPDTLLEKEVKNLEVQIKQEQASMQEKQKILSHIPNIAHRRVKLAMVLAKIADQNQIKITQKELHYIAQTTALQYNMNVDNIWNNQELLQKIKSSALEDRTINFILHQMTKEQKLKISYRDLHAMETYCHQESNSYVPWLHTQDKKSTQSKQKQVLSGKEKKNDPLNRVKT